MKKCASCTKDLPDAALHCVFCGAKQAPAPAVSAAANAKTVMGYGGQELDALRAQAAAANAARAGAPANLPAAAPYSAPQPGYAPAAKAATPDARPSSPSSGYGGAPAGGGYSPPAAGGYNPPAAGGYTPPSGGGYGGAPSGAGYNQPQGGYPQPGGYNPQPVQPVAPIPSAQPPYLASQTAARAGRPIEPWKDTLRVMMFVWGGLLLLAFVAPLSLDPMAFSWDTIITGEGKQKLGPLLVAAVGLLSIVIGAIPMASPARGALAAVLGLAGIFVPVFLDGMPPWQVLVTMAGMVVLVPSLLVRNEYRDASLARILVTAGVVAVLAPLLIPTNGNVPLAGQFQAVLDAEGQWKIVNLVSFLLIVVVALSLLAWLPSPSSGASKPLAWALIMWPLLIVGSTLFLDGGIDPTKSPASALLWVIGAKGAAIGSGFLAIASWGIATLIGKQLE